MLIEWTITSVLSTSPMERSLLLFNAIDALPEPTRQVVILTKLDGLTLRDVEERLKIPRSTAARYVHDGLRRLRETLSRALGETTDEREP